MNNIELNNKLIAIRNSLNNIETKGKQNLMNILGCIEILDEILYTSHNNIENKIQENKE